MALTDKGRWLVNLTFQDNNGKVASTGGYLPGALTLAEVNTRLTAFAAALSAVSDAVVVNGQISRLYIEPNPVAPPASSEVERKLVIPLGTANEKPGVSSIEVPSPIFGLEVAGTDVVNQTNAALVTLVTLLTEGSIGPGNGFVTYYGDDITRAAAAYISHRNRRAIK